MVRNSSLHSDYYYPETCPILEKSPKSKSPPNSYEHIDIILVGPQNRNPHLKDKISGLKASRQSLPRICNLVHFCYLG
jgi:hypothetical protein